MNGWLTLCNNFASFTAIAAIRVPPLQLEGTQLPVPDVEHLEDLTASTLAQLAHALQTRQAYAAPVVEEL
eukprot:CAMPEP_0115748018 /NCGR_PEP_ID=MMETSP0272-20121206/93459_1 /TAXON_ID=71861 /ORGANISM="Scrippsiella trochoidea, Strain CCMP3099" /LENGTH=69 /DNA_ID=CAMNT_0003193023 /DNA_START=392 /DNA_END=600 /DNA_ORIENTATION=+